MQRPKGYNLVLNHIFIGCFTDYCEHFIIDLWYYRGMPRFSKRTDADRGPLGRLLYNGRREASRNVETCAADCGLSKSFLHFVEQGRRAPALAQMLGIADAYKVERRQAAWAWILQSAPDLAIYLVSHETVASEPMLQSYFSDQYKEQVRAKEEARKAANAARRAAQNQRQAAKRAQGDSDIVGGPSPDGPDFDHVGLTMMSSRRIQHERQGTLPTDQTAEPPAGNRRPGRKE